MTAFIKKRNIGLEKKELFSGQVVDAAADLIVRNVEINGDVWATRGCSLYLKKLNDNKFIYKTELPGSFIVKLLSVKIVRNITNYHDILQPFWTKSHDIIVFSSGYIWRLDDAQKKFKKVLKLRNWGFKKGRGVLHHGFSQLPSGRLVFGEYFRNSDRADVLLYASDDGGNIWFELKKFHSGMLRHIHAVQVDPYHGALWLCSGDSNEESMIMRSFDEGETFEIIGKNSQLWRTCCLVFSEDEISWGVDTSGDVENRYLCSLNRKTMKLKRQISVDGAVEFGVKIGNDTLCFSTTRTGLDIESDNSPSLWFNLNKNGWKRMRLGIWDSKKFKRTGAPYLYANPVNDEIIVSLVNITPNNNALLFLTPNILTEY